MAITDSIYICCGMAIVAAIIGFRTRRQARRDANRYRLFAVRDHLILQVAEENVKEEDPLFQRYYRRVNGLVSREPSINTWNLAAAIVKEFGPGEELEFDLEMEMVKQAKPGMQEAVLEVYTTVHEVFRSNSTAIRWLLGDNPLLRFVGQVILFTECAMHHRRHGGNSMTMPKDDRNKIVKTDESIEQRRAEIRTLVPA